MDEIINEVYQLAGVSNIELLTMADYLPFMIKLTVTCGLIGGLFAVIGSLTETMLKWNRWLD